MDPDFGKHLKAAWEIVSAAAFVVAVLAFAIVASWLMQ